MYATIVSQAASVFNPVFRTFRIHWFSVKPCFDFLSARTLSPLGQQLLSPEHYSRADIDHLHVRLTRLGRRSHFVRTVYVDGKKVLLDPHGFWHKYMTNVAAVQYRGPWLGLAPMRLQFKDLPEARLLRVRPEFLRQVREASPAITRLSAFPKAYLFPIGWAVGVVVGIEVSARQPDSRLPSLTLETAPSLVKRLRIDEAFLFQNAAATLDGVLQQLHGLVGSRLLDRYPNDVSRDAVNAYSVSSPVDFEEQEKFDGDTLADIAGTGSLITGDPLVSTIQPLVTRSRHVLALTVFNRGTVLISAPDPKGSDNKVIERSPSCLLSGMKGALLMTDMMQKFHQTARGHSNPAVRDMRDQVSETFEQLKSSYSSPHFHNICANHAALKKMQQVKSGAQLNLTIEELKVSNFKINKVENAAIGDNAKFIQNADSSSLAKDLAKIRDAMSLRANTEEQKQDVAKVDAATQMAQNGDKQEAFARLRSLGAWGWDVFKELTSSIAAETLKELIKG
jgi:hypothetical protein